MLTRKAITAVLRDIGLGTDDSVLVHSSFRSLGPVEGGPETVIDGILDVIGPSGTMMAPTFSYGHVEPYFDPAVVPSRTGVISELLRQRPDAFRSLHPTHSVCAVGANAREFTHDHLDGGAFTIDSPVDRITQAGGYVLMLGVSHTSNSTIHVGETRAGIKRFSSLDGPDRIRNVLLPDGEVRPYTLDLSSGCSFAFNAMDLPLRRNGKICDFVLGSALSFLVRGKDIIAATAQLINDCPEAMLCTRSECGKCRPRRGYLNRRKAGPKS